MEATDGTRPSIFVSVLPLPMTERRSAETTSMVPLGWARRIFYPPWRITGQEGAWSGIRLLARPHPKTEECHWRTNIGADDGRDQADSGAHSRWHRRRDEYDVGAGWDHRPRSCNTGWPMGTDLFHLEPELLRNSLNPIAGRRDGTVDKLKANRIGDRIKASWRRKSMLMGKWSVLGLIFNRLYAIK